MEITLSKNNATGASDWFSGEEYGWLQIHVISVGASPTATIITESCNMITVQGSPVAVVPKEITTTTVTGTGDTYVAVDEQYKYIRIRCTANTNVNFTARLFSAAF